MNRKKIFTIFVCNVAIFGLTLNVFAEDEKNSRKGNMPLFVLTNEAHFSKDRNLTGASAFLVQSNNDNVYAVTAKHLLGDWGGISPEIQPSELQALLLSWYLLPRNKSLPKVQLEPLPVMPKVLLERDILFLKIKDTFKKAHLPAQPLFARNNAPRTGEAVSLYAVPYSEMEQSQRVYHGSVREVTNNEIRFSINPPVVTRGFSGAPVVDADGKVIAVYRAKAKIDEAGDSIEGFATILTDAVPTF